MSALTTGPWGEYPTNPLPPILQASLGCFVEQGYHGTVMRSIAAAAGLSVPGVYHHYESKQAILVALMRTAMSDLYERSEQALAAAGASIQSRLELHITCLVLFHAHRSELAFLAASEIRSLEGDARAEHIAARDRQQLVLDRIIAEGVAARVFVAESAHNTSRAIVTMCTGVAQWYRLGGPMSPESLAAQYVELVKRALGQNVDPSEYG